MTICGLRKIRTWAGLAILLAGTSFSSSAQSPRAWPQGISASRFAELDREVESGVYGNIDRILVVRGVARERPPAG
jgi:hypothetical protein